MDFHNKDFLVVDPRNNDCLIVDPYNKESLVVDYHNKEDLFVDPHNKDSLVVDPYHGPYEGGAFNFRLILNHFEIKNVAVVRGTVTISV